MLTKILEQPEMPSLQIQFTFSEIKILKMIFNHCVTNTDTESDKFSFICLTNEERLFVNNICRAIHIPILLPK